MLLQTQIYLITYMKAIICFVLFIDKRKNRRKERRCCYKLKFSNHIVSVEPVALSLRYFKQYLF